MALTEFQHDILRLLARNRSPNSYVAGETALNRARPRISRDLDIFHDAVLASAEQDKAALSAAGLSVEETLRSRPERGFVDAVIRQGGRTTEVQWAVDSAFRFFPVIADDLLGWRLHDYDLAVNKALALAGRREVRDYFDIVELHRSGVPLAALAWAAPAKDPGFTPLLLLDEMSRNAVHSAAEIAAGIETTVPIDPVEVKRIFLGALAEARRLTDVLPPDQVGHLYLDRDGVLALPDPTAVAEGRLVLHAGAIGGGWPQMQE